MSNFSQGKVLFDKYQIIRMLGKGGSSKVFLASYLKLGNLVAIKIVDKSLYGKQLIIEKEMLVKLRHSSIVVIFDLLEDDDYYYLIEEYVEGTTLEEYRGKIDEEEAISILLKLAEVFHYLHTAFENPIIYRDIKPSNIIYMPNKAIKIIDFGIASKNVNHATEEASNYGTRGYSAPEQIAHGKIDEKTDIFSLGVTIYYLLTGKNLSHPPYRIMPLRQVKKDVSSEFAGIIDKMTKTIPAKRYSSMKSVLSNLEDLISRENGISDTEVFKGKASKVMYVAGIKRGIGVTHICQLLAHAYARLGKKVATVEWQDRDSFVKISSSHEESIEHKRSYELKSVRGYYYSLAGFKHIIDEHYDIIIVDAGSYEEFLAKYKSKESADVYLVSSMSDWDIDLVEDMIYKGNKDIHYLINLPNNIKNIKEVFTDHIISSVPFEVDPYEASEEFMKSFRDITGEDVEYKNKEWGLYGFYVKAKKATQDFIKVRFKKLRNISSRNI